MSDAVRDREREIEMVQQFDFQLFGGARLPHVVISDSRRVDAGQIFQGGWGSGLF